MEIGAKIKKTREELNLKQIDVAEKAGITKQTLYKYENGIVTNIPSDKIELLARVLNVTPAYLMGWQSEDKENIKNDEELILTEEEKEIIRMYRTLHPAAKKFIFNSITAQQEPIKQNPEAEAEVERVMREIDELMKQHDDKSISAL